MKHIFSAVLGVALLSTGVAQADSSLVFGSTSASSSHYGYIVAVGKLINEKIDGVTANVVETGAAMDNIRRMERGQLDLGIITTNVAQHAVTGSKEFKGRAQDLALLWVYSESPQNAIVREDAGVDSLTGLNGVRFNPGIKGSATETTTESVFEKLDIQPEYVRGSTTDIVSAIKDNRLAGYVKSGNGDKLDASTMDVATSTDIRVLGLSPEQAETIRSGMPDVSVVDVPAGAADGIPAYTTWAFGVGVAATSAMSEETAYQIVATVMEDKTVQGNAMAAIKGADLAKRTLAYGTTPLHPGAARWFKENGYDLPDALKPTQ